MKITLRWDPTPGLPLGARQYSVRRRVIKLPYTATIADVLPLIAANGLALWPKEEGQTYMSSGPLQDGACYDVSSKDVRSTNNLMPIRWK